MSIFNYALILTVAFCLMFIGRYAVLFARGEKGVKSKIKKFSRAILTFAAVLAVGTCGLMACFTQLSQVLYNALSVDYIADCREVLKTVFGTESLFSAIQFLWSFAMLLFGLFSCSSCVYAVCVNIELRAADGRGGERCETVRSGRQIRIFAGRKLCYLFARNIN